MKNQLFKINSRSKRLGGGAIVALLLVSMIACLSHVQGTEGTVGFSRVDDVRTKIDLVMTQQYLYGKDNDTFLFVDYDAVTGLKKTDYSNINFIESILRAYVATGNETYLTWLQNSWNDIVIYGLNAAYSSYLTVNGYSGALSSRINITSNAEDLYTGSIYDMIPFIHSSLVLYDITANQTYLDVARNLTARIVDYRVNMTTGLTIMQYPPRRSAEAMYNESYGYFDIITGSAWYNILNVMYERTGNETYHSIVNVFLGLALYKLGLHFIPLLAQRRPSRFRCGFHKTVSRHNRALQQQPIQLSKRHSPNILSQHLERLSHNLLESNRAIL